MALSTSIRSSSVSGLGSWREGEGSGPSGVSSPHADRPDRGPYSAPAGGEGARFPSGSVADGAAGPLACGTRAVDITGSWAGGVVFRDELIAPPPQRAAPSGPRLVRGLRTVNETRRPSTRPGRRRPARR